MASTARQVGARSRRPMRDEELEDILNDSEFDYSGDDSDCDPTFAPPELDRDIRTDAVDSDTDSAEDSDHSDNAIISDHPAPSPTLSNDSRIIRSRGRGRRQGRGSHSRGRGRSLTNTRISTLRRNVGNNSDLQDKWSADAFEPEDRPLMQPAYLAIDSTEWEWHSFYEQYITEEILTTIVNCTNRTNILHKGKTLGLTIKELKVFLGMTMVMSALQYPQINMYWSGKYRVNIIASAMTRARFYAIRTQLKCVYDAEVTPDQKEEKIWKVKPLYDCILYGCHLQDRPQDMCIDEMIIPFTGRCNMRQYCPNKPNPVGLKVFVLASPQGIVCDMLIYQGDKTFPELTSQGFGLGESTVLYLTRTLVPGHSLYFDRYFTSVKLCDELLKRGYHGTGTIQRGRIPKDCKLTPEKEFKKLPRGSSEVKVREDGQLAITMWLDNKPVMMISTLYCNKNEDDCERWSKKKKRYERVKRPEVIKKYNLNMGGVDLADRMLSVCPSRSRTIKWTVRVISHLFDLAVVNSWFQYRATELGKSTSRALIWKLRDYKLNLGTKMIEDNDTESDGESDPNQLEELEPKHKKRKVMIKPVPSKQRRLQKASHMPDYGRKQSRCRHKFCDKKTTVFCKRCEVFLCFVPNRNCFASFHETDDD